MVGETQDVETIVSAMKQGAHTFLKQPVSLAALHAHVTEAVAEHQAKRQQSAAQADALRRLAKLTDKERDVLDLVIAGLTNREMAARLNLSMRGIEDRRARLMRKLRADSVGAMIELTRLARQADNA